MKCFRRKEFYGALVALLLMAGTISAGIPGSTVSAAGSTEAADPITIDSKLLNVKCQTRLEKGDSTKSLRMVTTVDNNLKAYGFVGFEVRFMPDDDGTGKYNDCKTTTVYQKIVSKYEKLKFEFSPKVFHADSKWMASYVITDIPEAYWDNDIIIRPYVTKLGTGDKTYGESKHLRIADYDGPSYMVSLAVKDPLGEKTTVDVDGTTRDVYRSAKYDSKYSHVRMPINNLSALPSVTKYKIEGVSEPVSYRNLYTESNSDTTWYNNTDPDNKVIANAAEMRGFSALSANKNFKGETIYLGADIELNRDWDASKGGVAGTKEWTPIGSSGINTGYKAFAGTFDGDMHSISGIYINQKAGKLGLFGETFSETNSSGETSGAKIQNLILKNSYIKTTNNWYSIGYTGAVVGKLNGNIDTVKCTEDVYVVGTSKGLGGVAGGAGNGTLNNVLFAGSVKMALDSSTKTNELGQERHYGGIIGTVYNPGDSCVMKNCLVTGKIDFGAYTGGLCGSVRAGSELTIQDSMYAGAFQEVGATKKDCRGTIVGQKQGATQTATETLAAAILTAENVYAGKEENVANLVGSDATAQNGMVALDRTGQLTGQEAYLNTKLNFYVAEKHEDGFWLARTDQMPILAKFAEDTDKETAVDITKIQGTRTGWYDENKQEYILYSPADLRGFSALSATNDFAGKTIKLGADIDLNPKWVASSSPTTAPNEWTPIGSSGINTGYKAFAGTFDGHMHSISGIYINKTVGRLGLFGETSGATIQNLILKNSYIKSDGKTYNMFYTGSVVGLLNGEINTIKCEADVYVASNAKGIGGLAGGALSGKINNCWFAGSVTVGGSTDSGLRDHGGLVGVIYSNVEAPGPDPAQNITIENSLVTGKIEKTKYSGGLFGSVYQNGSVTINNSLFAGEMAAGTADQQVGLVMAGKDATTGAKATITLNNVYAVQSGAITGSVGYGTVDTTKVSVFDGTTQLFGDAAYCNIDFNFDIPKVGETGNWVALKDHAPVQKCFAGTVDKANHPEVDLTQAQGTRTFWYDESKTEYILYTPADLRGFSKLSTTTDFTGKTIRLGADMDLNPGWQASAMPEGGIPFNPINQKFAGTFDGGMHTLSGIFVKGTSNQVSNSIKGLGLFAGTSANAVIRNFVLSNSCIWNTTQPTETSKYPRGYTGAIVGVLNTDVKVDTVKCDETVFVTKEGTEYTGGITGRSVGGIITNCWFAGNISGTGGHTGGILGGLPVANDSCTIEHCLMTGKFDKRTNSGGICSTIVASTSLTIHDSLFAGGTNDVGIENPGQHATIIGNLNNKDENTVTITDTYSLHTSPMFGNIGNHDTSKYGATKLTEGELMRGEVARINAPKLSIYPEGESSSPDETPKKYWWVTRENQVPALESFSK